MLTNSAMVHIKSQTYQGSDQDEIIEILAPGTLKLTEGKAILEYEEALEEDTHPQKVTITVDSEGVDVERMGPYAMKLCFQEKHRYQGIYQTPFGGFDVAIFCTELQYDINEDGGEIHICYQLDMNGEFASMHEVHYKIIAGMSDDD